MSKPATSTTPSTDSPYDEGTYFCSTGDHEVPLHCFVSPKGRLYKTCNDCRAKGAKRTAKKRLRKPIKYRSTTGPPMAGGHGDFVRQHFHDASLDSDPRGMEYKKMPCFDPDKERAARTELANKELAFIKSLHQKARDDEMMRKMESRWNAHVRKVGIEAALQERSPYFKLNRAREVKKMETAKAAEAARIAKLDQLDRDDNARKAKRQRLAPTE